MVGAVAAVATIDSDAPSTLGAQQLAALTPCMHRLDVGGEDTAGEAVVQFFKSELQSAQLSQTDAAALSAAAAQLTDACTNANEFAAAEAAIEAAYACAPPASRRFILAMKLALQADSAQQAMTVATRILLPPLQITEARDILSGAAALAESLLLDPSLDVEVRLMLMLAYYWHANAELTESTTSCVSIHLS